MHAVDRTQSIGMRASELMRAYSRTASPRCYELWYTYVTGLKPQLNEAVKRLISTQGALSGDDVETLYDTHFAPDRLTTQTVAAGSSLLLEIEQVMGLIEAAVGSTAQYGASLEALGDKLAGTEERNRTREIVEALVAATREVAGSNKDLEVRLKASRGEVEGLQRALEEARTESMTDALTGLANRKHFETTLTTSVARAQAESSPLTLVVIDIDEFKRFNDTYGHLTGDQVLRLVGAAMRENVGRASTLSRFGGEEFAIILPETTPEQAFVCAEKIRKNVMSRELLKRSTRESLGRVTISLGIATLQPDDTPVSILDRADLCMYQAKKLGRNRTVFDTDVPATASPVSAAA